MVYFYFCQFVLNLLSHIPVGRILLAATRIIELVATIAIMRSHVLQVRLPTVMLSEENTVVAML